MTRIVRRTLGVCIGVALGWYVAGLAPSFMPGLRVSMAEDTGHHAAPVAATQPSSESGEPAAKESGIKKEEAPEAEAGRRAADELVPPQPEEQVPWFWPVVWAAAGLFIAAVLLGVPSLKLRGPLPPDPADTPHDDHDHDEHGTAGHH